MRAERDGQTPATEANVLVRARDVAIAYGPNVAVEGVTFSIERGRRVGLIGPNGGGKTTLVRALLGDVRPSAGTLEVRSTCAGVPQTQRSRLDYPVTALDVALMGTIARTPWWRGPGRAERASARDALAEVGMAAAVDTLFGELSGGQQQRVLIARALVRDAGLLLMDEPFTGVDAANVAVILELIDRLSTQGRGLLVATHDVDQVREWDAVLALNHRQVAFGAPDDVLVPEILAATYPGSVVVLSHQGHAVHHDESGEHRHQ